MSNKVYIYTLKSCVWEITLACCFSCKYCGSKAGTARKNELSTVECLNIAEQLSDVGCKRVSLIGGEVFMRRDWAEIVKKLTDNNINVSIITNGYLFSDELISELKNLNIESVAVSLDGPQHIHDAFRQKDSFNRAINAIDVLSQNDIPVSVISTLHSKNVDSLNEMYDILKNKNIYAWQLQACSPMGNAKTNDLSTVIDFKKVINFAEEHINSSAFVIGIADNIGYYTQTDGFLRGNINQEVPFHGCRAGLTAIGIDSVGNVRGCESLYDDSFIEGNLREKTLYEIWNNPDAFAYNRKFKPEYLQGKCRNCKHSLICAGGCRSYNFFSHRNLYESFCCANDE